MHNNINDQDSRRFDGDSLHETFNHLRLNANIDHTGQIGPGRKTSLRSHYQPGAPDHYLANSTGLSQDEEPYDNTPIGSQPFFDLSFDETPRDYPHHCFDYVTECQGAPFQYTQGERFGFSGTFYGSGASLQYSGEQPERETGDGDAAPRSSKAARASQGAEQGRKPGGKRWAALGELVQQQSVDNRSHHQSPSRGKTYTPAEASDRPSPATGSRASSRARRYGATNHLAAGQIHRSDTYDECREESSCDGFPNRRMSHQQSRQSSLYDEDVPNGPTGLHRAATYRTERLPTSRSFDLGSQKASRDSGRFSFGAINERPKRVNGPSSWGQLLAPDQRLEQALFGTDRTSTGINFDDYERIPVSCTGQDVPQPIERFCHVQFNSIVTNNIALARYDKPTPVQKYAIPTVLNGRDMMACAQTGSGKTAAFLLPIISSLLNGPPPAGRLNNKKAPIALILSPTRELCIQIFDEARKFAYRSSLRTAVVYGGAPMGAQIREIDRGVDLLVATTGRLTDFLERGIICLNHIRFLVLDEADRMLDMGFEPQIRKIIQEFGMPPTGSRLTLMFSATFPKLIQELASTFLQDYVFLCVGRIGSTSESITQQIFFVREHEKCEVLLRVLEHENDGLNLVFVETKRGADILENYLQQRKCRVCCIHGDRNQKEREHALKIFRSGQAPVLVATAVAARGLDIPNVRQVVNYDLPNDINEYVHRIGRTGRVGNIGKAISFFNEGNMNILHDLVSLLEECNQEVPDFLRSLVLSSDYRWRTSAVYSGRKGSASQNKPRYSMGRTRDVRTLYADTLSSGVYQQQQQSGCTRNASDSAGGASQRLTCAFSRCDSAPQSSFGQSASLADTRDRAADTSDGAKKANHVGHRREHANAAANSTSWWSEDETDRE